MQPITCTFWPNGGTDPAELWATPRKVHEGWHKEVAVQIAAGELTADAGKAPAKRFIHLPWGGDPNLMAMDSLRMARELGLKKLADPVSFHWALRTLAACDPTIENNIYLGCPENSPRMMEMWKRSRSQWTNAVDAALRPVIKLAEAGVKCRVYLDGSASRDDKSPSAAASLRVKDKHRIPIGVEARVHLIAESWANHEDIDVLAWASDWHSQEGRGEIVPTARLKGRQILICKNAAAGAAEKLAGRSVAVIEYAAGEVE